MSKLAHDRHGRVVVGQRRLVLYGWLAFYGPVAGRSGKARADNLCNTGTLLVGGWGRFQCYYGSWNYLTTLACL
jgi:hypothetical protein